LPFLLLPLLLVLTSSFYLSDPIEGSLKLDGVEVKDLNVRWLRNQIGLVSQEPTLFATTVATNIEHGLIGSRFENESPEEKRSRVVEAAKLANADGFIRLLPNGYDTHIGERGGLLSGGQKRASPSFFPASLRSIQLIFISTSLLVTADRTRCYRASHRV
jgi:ATP-binding cassette subfamily B (MDR/TAP) protein 1